MTQARNLFPLFFIAIIGFFFSCNKQEETNFPEMDYSYFPLGKGAWISYDVTEITIDKASELYDTNYYHIKEIIDTGYVDSLSLKSFKVKRYVRVSSTEQWAIKDIWSVNLTEKSAEKTEENVRFVKLRFPAKINLTWNGNIYNNFDAQQYEITGIDEPQQILGFSFDSVLTVTQKADSNIIKKEYHVEKYAKNLGLIYKEQTDISSQEVDITKPIEERITTATILIMKINAFGYE
jgi:hypothetical protein